MTAVLDHLEASLRHAQVPFARRPCRYYADFTRESSLFDVYSGFEGETASRAIAGFWLAAGQPRSVVGLYTGFTFAAGESCNLVELVTRMDAHRRARSMRTVSFIEPGIVETFALEGCCFITLVNETTHEHLRGVCRDADCVRGLTSLWPRLANHVDICVPTADGLVACSAGPARAVVCISGGGRGCPGAIRAMVNSHWPGSDHSSGLIRGLQDALGLSAFDEQFNNRIHWDDPYYSTDRAVRGGSVFVPINADSGWIPREQ